VTDQIAIEMVKAESNVLRLEKELGNEEMLKLYKLSAGLAKALVAVALHGISLGFAAETEGETLEAFASTAAMGARVTQGSVRGMAVTGVAFREEVGCKMVGVWFDEITRAIRNYKVCGTKVSNEGHAAHVPRTRDVDLAVRQAMKSAVLKGDAFGKMEEFSIRVTRIGREENKVNCMTELVITADGGLSFYGVQNSCL
jgi:hypothetical protein